MFLDTTSISDSTLSSSAQAPTPTLNNQQHTKQSTQPIETRSDQISNNCTTPSANEPKQPTRSDTTDITQEESLSSSSSSSCLDRNHNIAAIIQNILAESLARVKTWLSASFGAALWATLSFINHFIESQLIPGLPSSSNNTSNSSPAASDTSQHCQLAWRDTSSATYHTLADDCRHPDDGEESIIRAIEFVSSDDEESSYLSAVERARKWSEETESVLGGGDYGEHNISNIYGACNCRHHGSSLLLYNSGANANHIHSIDMSSQRDFEHRGRFAQRAYSEYNNNNHNHTPVRLLSTPLALPLHGSGGGGPAYLYTDALQIHRHAASPFAAAHRVGPQQQPPPTNNSRATHSGSSNNNDKEEVRRGPPLCGAGGVQQQQQQQAADFQGQRHQACCSLEACSQSTHILQGEGGHYNERPHKQQGQREHELLGPLRALFGMQNTRRATDNSQQQDTNSSASGSRHRKCNQQQQQYERDNHQDDNQLERQQQHERSESPLVLVSKSTLSDLTKQIAFSMNKMKDLEEKVRVIPELERRLHNVISDTDSRSSSIRIRDSKYSVDNNHSAKTGGNSNNNNNNNYYPLRRSSLNESSPSHNIPYNRTMFSSSLRQPYGGSMQYTPGYRIASAVHSGSSHHHPQAQQSGNGESLARASSFSLSSPHSNGQRYFDKLVRGNRNTANNGNSRQSLDHISNALRSTQDSLNSGNSALSTKVEYEELINDLISLSYSVNYLPFSSNQHSPSAQSESSSGGCTDAEGGATSGSAAGAGVGAAPGAGSRSQQVEEKHGNRLEPHDAIRVGSAAAAATTSKTKQQQQQQQQQSNQQQHSSNKQQHVISNSQPSTYQFSNFNQNSLFNSNNHSSMSHLCQQQQQHHHHHHHATRDHHSNSYLRNNYNGSNGALSLQTTPVKTPLDCGCQSFKEHLRYNSISREQRLAAAASTKSSQQVISSNTSSNNVSPQPQQQQQPMVSRKADASTNTDLSMEDVVTKSELSKLVEEFRKSTKLSPPASLSLGSEQTHSNNNNNTDSVTRNISSSPMSEESSSGSATGPNSSSQPESRSTSSGDDRMDGDEDEGVSDDNVGMKTNSSASAKDISDDDDEEGGDLKEGSSLSVEELSHDGHKEPTGNGKGQQPEEDEDDDDDDDEIEVNLNSIEGAEEAYSLGSSYQDPSDFEEYCAYGESLDRRTKDFLSQTTKIPNDLRFALIRLNDAIKKDQPFAQIESSTNCIEIIRKEWFDVAANNDAQAIKTKLYVDFFESFTKQLLNIVVNLTDSAGNTAMHYAASHFKLDIIEVLLDTKVCDVNCRNKAGYTPMMLLALADLEDPYDQGVARHLFSMGDVNIKARSSGQTALMLAASHGRVSTCKLLLECGADPSQQDYDGSTALMYGSELGNEDVVRCLLAHRLTDPNATDNDGLDALTIAMNNGHKGIGLILYAAKNVPGRMTTRHHSATNPRLSNSTSSYLGASLRRSRGKSVTNHVRRADSLLGSRHSRSVRQFAVNNV